MSMVQGKGSRVKGIAKKGGYHEASSGAGSD